MDIVEKMSRIADASRREDGSDIPLGMQCREAASEIERLRRALFAALHDVEVIFDNDTPTDLEWKAMPDDGEMLVRRSLNWRVNR